MQTFTQALATRRRCRQTGLTTVEYAIAGGAIVLSVVTAIALFGPAVANLINSISNAF